MLQKQEGLWVLSVILSLFYLLKVEQKNQMCHGNALFHQTPEPLCSARGVVWLQVSFSYPGFSQDLIYCGIKTATFSFFIIDKNKTKTLQTRPAVVWLETWLGHYSPRPLMNCVLSARLLCNCHRRCSLMPCMRVKAKNDCESICVCVCAHAQTSKRRQTFSHGAAPSISLFPCPCGREGLS